MLSITKSEDKRTRRSKRLLKQGLSELLKEKSFADISVKDITEKMDMNRGTFYLHYKNTHDLLVSLEMEMFEDAQAMIDEYLPKIDGFSVQPVFEPVLDYIIEHKEICKTLFNDNYAGMFVDRLYKLIYENGAYIVKDRFVNASESEIGFVISFIIYGLIGLIKDWFSNMDKVTKQEILKVADRLVDGACRRLFEGESREPQI